MEAKSLIIPTEYKGYRFRSRLEARWAVFLDAIGFKWNYEPEGYILKKGLCYLPDFQLEDGTFLEVKPKELNEEELMKARLLAKITNEKVIFLVGVPDYKNYEYTSWSEEEKFIDEDEIYDNTLILVPKDEKHHPFYYSSGWSNEVFKNEFASDTYHKAIMLSRKYNFNLK